MTINFFPPRVDGMDLTNIWLQHDGATCHTARETLNLLYEKFEGAIISRGGHPDPDLTPLDLFCGAT